MSNPSTKFNMTKDVGGYNGFGVVAAVDMYNGKLSVGAADSLTVPSNYPYWLAVFSYTPGANVFVNVQGATAVSPTGAIAAHQAELNPSARMVKSGTVISMITPDAAGSYVSVALYVVPVFGN